MHAAAFAWWPVEHENHIRAIGRIGICVVAMSVVVSIAKRPIGPGPNAIACGVVGGGERGLRLPTRTVDLQSSAIGIVKSGKTLRISVIRGTFEYIGIRIHPSIRAERIALDVPSGSRVIVSVIVVVSPKASVYESSLARARYPRLNSPGARVSRRHL
jgi:hypothetical protein